MSNPDVVITWDDQALALAIDGDPAVQRQLAQMANEAVLTMKYLCPVSPVGPLHRSGNLRSSIHAFRMGTPGDRYYIIGPTADYAPYVEEDTRPHLIVSHGPWPLRNRETGQVFGRVVHHPGTRGQHFVQRTADTFSGRMVTL